MLSTRHSKKAIIIGMATSLLDLSLKELAEKYPETDEEPLVIEIVREFIWLALCVCFNVSQFNPGK